MYDDSYEYAVKLAEEKGFTFIHPFDDLAVATGQGTIAMEIVQELPTVDYILVPVGGGGLITGISTLARMLNPKIKVIGVEPKNAASMTAALENDSPMTLASANTIADGTAVKRVGEKIFPYCSENIYRMLTVEDSQLINAFLDMVENHKMIVENSGLLPVAALDQLDLEGKKAVLVLSGGNMDVITMASVVQHGLIQKDRIFTVSVLLPDKAGELVKVASSIANAGGNVIKLEHNQFVSINRNASVELRITMEAYGTEHKNSILMALRADGYNPQLVTLDRVFVSDSILLCNCFRLFTEVFLLVHTVVHGSLACSQPSVSFQSVFAGFYRRNGLLSVGHIRDMYAVGAAVKYLLAPYKIVPRSSYERRASRALCSLDHGYYAGE